MIKNIIFDFGDIFINLDKEGAMTKALKLFAVNQLTQEMLQTNMNYEMGLISTEDFIKFYKKRYPHLSVKEIRYAWNCILLDFPLHRLEFIKNTAKNYRCFLLSNTNEMHIDWIKKDWGSNLYNEFKACFEQFYLSHEINLRKPNTTIYEFVLKQNNLIASETLFIDDLAENTSSAANLGMHVWNLTPGKEDVANLFSVKKELF